MQNSADYLSVTTLTKYLKAKFERDPYLERVYLVGEISNFRLRPNGHQYFSLKDDHAKINAVMFKSAFQKVRFAPKEGLKVLVVGRISLYEASGAYQIYVEHMELDGVGALYQALKELQEKLAKEGLFAAPKKPIPLFPKKIAVLTSPSGAVIRDIITTLDRRYPLVELDLYPTLVQGNQAADNIVKNIKQVEAAGDVDVMIIARGGGSIEDLWPFNEERVARAIFAAKTPVISSVGHETDTTIADLVADLRAPTPTAAAELAVPSRQEILSQIADRRARLVRQMQKRLLTEEERLQKIQTAYIFRQPERLYEGLSMRVDLAKNQLTHGFRQILSQKEKRVQHNLERFRQFDPTLQVSRFQQKNALLKGQLFQEVRLLLNAKTNAVDSRIQALDLMSPLKTMTRGFAYVTKNEKIVRTVQDLALQETVEMHFADGTAYAEVKQIKEEKNDESESIL